MWAPGLTELDTWSDPALLRPDGEGRGWGGLILLRTAEAADPSQSQDTACADTVLSAWTSLSLKYQPQNNNLMTRFSRNYLYYLIFLMTHLIRLNYILNNTSWKCNLLSHLITHVCGMAFGDNIGRQSSNNSNFHHLWRVKFDYARPKSLFVV